MIDLGVLVHPAWTGGQPIDTYLDRLMGFGVRAVELQIPPSGVEHVAPWKTLIEAARLRSLRVALHAPLPANHPGWSDVMALIADDRAPQNSLVVMHGDADRQFDSAVSHTVDHARALLRQLPPKATLAIEQGCDRTRSWSSTIRRRYQRWMRRRQDRPAGVGSGMGAAVQQPIAPRKPAAQELDPGPSRRYIWSQATATREAIQQVVETIGDPRCVIAWDLAHDLIGREAQEQSSSMPGQQFLERVGYVRVHDVDAAGIDHWPLVLGNVPYATQLRGLWRSGFDGIVCVALRYTAGAASYGDRWQVFEQSIQGVRQALKLS